MMLLQPGAHATHPTARRAGAQNHTSVVARASSRRDALAAAGLLLATAAAASHPVQAAAAAAAAAPPKPFCGVVDIVPSWAYSTPWQEELVDFAGGKTWYRWVNYVPPAGKGGLFARLTRRYSPVAPDKLPLLVVAGGPGFASTYLEPLELMVGVGRQVIFFDAVGCGNTFLASNDSCPPPEQLTPELYLHQIDALRAALSLERCHLYGQGVGGMLALSYAASRGGSSGGSSGVVSVTAASVAPSYKQLIADRRAAAKALLGDAGSQQLFQADGSSTVGGSSSAEWQQYVQQHVCRSRAALAPAGGCVTRVQQQQSQPVFAALAGGRYFEAAGRLADWSAASLDAAALQEVPVLVSRGEYDEVTPGSAQQLAAALPSTRGQVNTCAGSGSYVHIDAWEPHLTRVELHLCEAEGSTPPSETS